MAWRIIMTICIVCRSAHAGIPVLYSTDLYHPHNDPDDHYDLLTLFSMPELDVRALVIDMGEPGKGRPGLGAVAQMDALRGKQTPVATGLIGNLRSPEDAAVTRTADEQAGVELILKTLQESPQHVTIFAVGSMRDMAAAYNRAPALFREKVGRFYVNAGDTRGKVEYNVGLDPLAYRRIMTSGLPIYWTPCFGDDGHGSFWKFRQNEVLDTAAPPILNFFLYMYSQSTGTNPLEYLNREPDTALLTKVSSEDRAMWCTASFLHAAGRSEPSFCYEPQSIALSEDGTTVLDSKATLELKTIHVSQPERYPEAMTRVLRQCAAMPTSNFAQTK